MLFLIVACTSSTPPPKPDPAPVAPPSPPKVELRKLTRKPPKTDRSPVREAWQKIFPDRQVFVCGKPVVIPTGMYQAGEALVVVDKGTTQVVTTEPEGEAQAIAEGIDYGQLSWEGTECRWEGQQLIKALGKVEGGGVHTVIGCPGGSRQTTQQDGTVKLRFGSARSCEARVVDAETLALGEPVVLARGAKELELKPTTEAVPAAELARAVKERKASLKARLDRVQSEKKRMEGVDVESRQATWYRSWLAEEQGRVEQAISHADTTDGKLEAIARHL